jgi:hypothetical protein
VGVEKAGAAARGENCATVNAELNREKDAHLSMHRRAGPERAQSEALPIAFHRHKCYKP